MAQDVLPDLETDRPPVPPRPHRTRRRRSAREAGVAIVVCLLGWALLFGPVLERNARSGPVGARRTVALAVLRPVTAISDAIGLTSVATTALRALGEDPAAQAGGELELPDVALPPLPPAGATGSMGGEPRAPRREGRAGEDGADAPDPATIRTPTRAHPLRVAVVGDSLSQGLGAAIASWFDADLTRVLSLGRQSTGLARQDYFNWTRAMREIGERFRPDLVFVLLGTNDAQPQISPDGSTIPVGSTEWVEAYRARAAAFVRETTSRGGHVIWVGLPIVRDRDAWSFYERANSLYRETTDADPLATYVDTWSAFDGRDGGYSAFARNERGVLQEMRASDGMHFTPAGYAYLARLAIRAADDAWGLADRTVNFRL